MVLDPRIHAVRGDLADIGLADRVFAPHYAVPLRCRVVRATPLLTAPGGEALAALAADEPFAVLELTDGHAWGTASGVGLVGYVERAALA